MSGDGSWSSATRSVAIEENADRAAVRRDGEPVDPADAVRRQSRPASGRPARAARRRARRRPRPGNARRHGRAGKDRAQPDGPRAHQPPPSVGWLGAAPVLVNPIARTTGVRRRCPSASSGTADSARPSCRPGGAPPPPTSVQGDHELSGARGAAGPRLDGQARAAPGRRRPAPPASSPPSAGCRAGARGMSHCSCDAASRSSPSPRRATTVPLAFPIRHCARRLSATP